MKKFKLLPFIFVGLISNSYANQDYLSQTKQDILNYSYDKAKEDSNKLKNDWINPINYQYIYSNTDEYDTTKSYISISQPIFKSGGIYFAIKYANSVRNETNISIDVQKKELIKEIVNLLFQIKKINVNISKQNLLIQNALLDIQRKKEQVLNGILDTSFLDNAILDGNSKRNTLIDLEYEKITLINNLSNLSDKKFEELEVPKLSITNQNNFIDQNIYVQQAKDEINTSYWFKNLAYSNYLPTVNLTANYTKYHDTDNQNTLIDESTNYGFNITIPFDIKSSNTIQSAKIEYLQKKSLLQEKETEEQTIFNNVKEKINSLKKKMQIAKNDIKLYDSLVTQIKEQLEVGIKTQSDLETIENSQKVKELDIKSLKIEEQIELLEIYSRMQK